MTSHHDDFDSVMIFLATLEKTGAKGRTGFAPPVCVLQAMAAHPAYITASCETIEINRVYRQYEYRDDI